MKEAVSGGENSRLTLALKSVFNRLNPYDLMVFDEIDSGISGQVAFKAAMKMKEMASVSQIIAISHLPQVVASADNCYFVYKDSNADSTSSHIEQIEGKRTTEEIAKMISGSEMTPAAFKAALDLQKSFKAN
jgi:DNA repair protein RecN (Recombination protein N)